MNRKNNEIGAGIIIWNVDSDNVVKFFVCTPGGPGWRNKECWNFPKGLREDGESSFENAVREFYEETGVYPGSLNKDDYVYHGYITQRANKHVDVYSKMWYGEELSNETCYSNTFTWTDGKEYPEIGKYAWLSLDEIKARGGVKAYYDVFQSIIDNFNKNK